MRAWPCCLPYSPNRMSVNGGTRNEYQGRCLSVVGSFWFCLLFVTFHLVCIILLLSCRCSHFIRHAMWPYNTHDTCRTNPQVGMSRYGYLAVCKVDGLHRGRDKHVEYMSSLQSKIIACILQASLLLAILASTELPTSTRNIVSRVP